MYINSYLTRLGLETDRFDVTNLTTRELSVLMNYYHFYTQYSSTRTKILDLSQILQHVIAQYLQTHHGITFLYKLGFFVEEYTYV